MIRYFNKKISYKNYLFVLWLISFVTCGFVGKKLYDDQKNEMLYSSSKDFGSISSNDNSLRQSEHPLSALFTFFYSDQYKTASSEFESQGKFDELKAMKEASAFCKQAYEESKKSREACEISKKACNEQKDGCEQIIKKLDKVNRKLTDAEMTSGRLERLVSKISASSSSNRNQSIIIMLIKQFMLLSFFSLKIKFSKNDTDWSEAFGQIIVSVLIPLFDLVLLI